MTLITKEGRPTEWAVTLLRLLTPILGFLAIILITDIRNDLQYMTRAVADLSNRMATIEETVNRGMEGHIERIDAEIDDLEDDLRERTGSRFTAEDAAAMRRDLQNQIDRLSAMTRSITDSASRPD